MHGPLNVKQANIGFNFQQYQWQIWTATADTKSPFNDPSAFWMRFHKCRLWTTTFSYQMEHGTGYRQHYPAAAVRVNKSCLFSTTRLDIHSVCRFRHSCCQSRDELQHLLFPHPPEHFLPTFCLRFALDIDEVFEPNTFLQLNTPWLQFSTEYI